jgi:hypothetical protein
LHRTAQIEGSDEARRLKALLEGLSEEELRELQAIAFYGRSQYRKFAEALRDAQPGQLDEKIGYTMSLIAAAG